jgi:pSer/pThr/pTyr-binding forkhead associated (FHA) protein
VLVNGKRVKRAQQLAQGDRIELGTSELVFQVE